MIHAVGRLGPLLFALSVPCAACSSGSNDASTTPSESSASSGDHASSGGHGSSGRSASQPSESSTGASHESQETHVDSTGGSSSTTRGDASSSTSGSGSSGEASSEPRGDAGSCVVVKLAEDDLSCTRDSDCTPVATSFCPGYVPTVGSKEGTVCPGAAANAAGVAKVTSAMAAVPHGEDAGDDFCDAVVQPAQCVHAQCVLCGPGTAGCADGGNP